MPSSNPALEKSLYLCFPQWQGAVTAPDLPSANTMLKGCLNRLDFVDVRVKPYTELSREAGVYGLADLIEQYQTCASLLASAQPDKIFTLGGDCAIELAPIRALHRRYGERFGVLWFDAHADSNTPKTSTSGYFHGMPLAMLMGAEGPEPLADSSLPPLNGRQVILVGARDLDPAEETFICKQGVRTLSVEQLTQNPALLVESLQRQGIQHVYIHLDLDVLDPTEFDKVTFNVPNGLTLLECRSLLSMVVDSSHVVGGSMTEFIGRVPEEAQSVVPLFETMITASVPV